MARPTGLGLAALAHLVGLSAGCAMIPPNSFLDPTAVGRWPLDLTDFSERGIRRTLTPREGAGLWASASEPTPEDLLPEYTEYRLGPLDQVSISIEDFLASGAVFNVGREVSATGYIRLPQLGSIRVVGMTEQELEREIGDRVRELQILPNPLVQVFIGVKRDQFFAVLGGVRQSGPVGLNQPDLRLLEALALVGDVTPDVKKIYVIRRTDDELPDDGSPTPRPPAEDDLVIPPPDVQDEGAFQSTLFVGAGPSAQEASPAATRPAEDRDAFEQILAPASSSVSQSQPAAAPEDLSPAGSRPFQPLVYDPSTGEMREAAPPRDAGIRTPSSDLPFEGLEEGFDWEDVPDYELSQRVIEIDVPALKSGDPRFNIVIRNKDVINVPIDTGVFYLMGQVNRPGVYGFGGREVTVKQAIATAGNFAALAWPTRAEIIRREAGTDKQFMIPVNLDRIFAGLEDDILLKDADIVNVGTDIVAPFLFVIRNSFRFTYGFGFVYDRNFADQDSIGGKPNPEVLELQRRQSLGLPF